MRILALIGSPRKGSNTDILVDEALRGSQARGHTFEKIYLYEYDISPCIDCRKCKGGDCVCVLEDAMPEIYEKIDEANVIVFGTPNYWYGPSAKMKLLIDRLRPYVANGKLKENKGIVISPAAEGPGVCGPLVEMFRMSFDYLGMQFAGKALGTAYERGEITNDKTAMTNAYDLGASL